MGDERRWAARYQFLDELWRGQGRIVYDLELEAALHAGGPQDGSLATLLDRLIPRGTRAGTQAAPGSAWMILGNDRRGTSLARVRAGTVFAGLDSASELATEESWSVAMVHLGGGSSPEREAMLEVLGEATEGGDRTLVLTAPVEDGDEDGAYEGLADLVEEIAGDGRIYGLTRPGLAAFYDFGALLEAPEGETQDNGRREGAGGSDVEEPPSIEVDNSLGAASPRFELFVAVVGPKMPSEGVAFIELPGSEAAELTAGSGRRVSDSTKDELAPLKAQLVEVQRRCDTQAIERQELLDELGQAQDQIAGLEEELEEARASGGTGERERGDATELQGRQDRLDVALAREQTLRWELTRTRGELENLQSRPVEAVEAELATGRHQLGEAQSELADRALRVAELEVEVEERGRRIIDLEAALSRAQAAAQVALQDDEDDDDDDDEFEDEYGDSILIVESEERSPARHRELMASRGRLERLLRKLERGGQLSALELHRELAKLL